MYDVYCHNKAVFLDRDGTINVDKGYLYKISDFEFIPYVIEGLKLLQDAGYLLIIITNQSGIARGYYSEEDFNRLNDWMLDTLRYKHKIHITSVYYCPHLPLVSPISRKGKSEETREVIPENLQKYRIHCHCRKPALGLFEKAIRDYEIDLSNSYAIGDKLRDLSICEKSDCKGFLILNNTIRRKGILSVSSLYEAAIKISK